jgi:hypothetical protein
MAPANFIVIRFVIRRGECDECGQTGKTGLMRLRQALRGPAFLRFFSGFAAVAGVI